MVYKFPSYLIVMVSSWISRLISVSFQLLSIRLLLKGLGTEPFAVFALLTGMTGWFSLADLGIGTSLQNYVSEQRAQQRPYREHIAAAGGLAVILLVVFILVLYQASPYCGPLLLKGFQFLNSSQKTQYFYITGLCLITTCIGTIICKIWYAEQKGVLANILPAIGSGLGLFGIWLVNRQEPPNKLYFYLLANLAPMALLSLAFLLFKVIPQVLAGNCWSWAIFRRLMARAFQFWIFFILAASVLQMDYIVLSQLLPPRDIALYALATKVFTLVFFVYNALLFALWPVCAEAIHQGQWSVVLGLIKKYIWYGFALVGIATLLIARTMPTILTVLAPNQGITISTGLIFLLGFYYLLRVWTDTYAMVLQSMSVLSPLWLWVPLQSLASVILQWTLAKSLGVYGVILGLIGCYILTVSWALPRAVKKRAAYD